MKRSFPGARRRFDASFCDSSDDGIEIGANCDTSSGNITYSYTSSPSKRIRKSANLEDFAVSGTLEATSETQQECPSFEGLDSQNNDEDSEGQGQCKQGTSAKMAPFSKELPFLHRCLLDKEYHTSVGQACQCGSNQAKYRCRSCTQNCLRCRSCILKDHHLYAWHHLEEWLGTHFGRTTLGSLGYRHYLGHYGQQCPVSSHLSVGRKMVVVHTNGFHEVFVEFCVCNGSPTKTRQLMSANLFPATLEKPETVFTFELLDTFQKLSFRSKINAYDYHRSLQEMTDSAFVEDLPNRYHEFVRVSRVWNHLDQVRRSGQCHDFNDVFACRRQGSVTVRCPACPEVHVNVDKESVDQAGEDEAHKYTLFLSIDGNFKLRRKNKRGDPDDVSLNNGQGYFVNASAYGNYLKHTHNECDEVCECAHLRALKFRNSMRFKNNDVSGVIVVQCARHGFYQPGGMADLKRGEEFRITDYALASTLADSHDQRWIMVTYDIWCSYHKHLEQRFEQWFPGMLAVIEKIRGAVPKLHVKNHKLLCQYLWALNFLRYSGETSGELIEACHSEQNGAAASTKEQNPGHRHDSIDGVVNYWNWTKFRTMGSSSPLLLLPISDNPPALSLYRSYVRCLDTLKTREKNFSGLTKRMGPGMVKEWEAMDDTPRIIDQEIHSVHRPTFGQGPPTLAKAHERLLRQEATLGKGSSGGMGVTENVRKALDIEHMQYLDPFDNVEEHSFSRARLDIKRSLKSDGNSRTDEGMLSTARQRLKDELDGWRTQQLLLFPKLRDEFHMKVSGSLYEVAPEDEPLLLPSSFSEPYRMLMGLQDVEKVEKGLREGRAHDLLDEIRTAIQTYNHHIALKSREVCSQRHITRAQNIVNGLRNDIRRPAHHYNKTREALLNLGFPSNDPVLRELKDTDLWAKNTALPTKVGDSRLQDPWFWHIAYCGGTTTADKANFQRESEVFTQILLWFQTSHKRLPVDRVKYFRERSLRDRAREEREILEEEFKRTARSYDALQAAWLGQAGKFPDAGRRAYAHKQAAMLARLSKNCDKLHTRAMQKAKVYDDW